MSLADAFDILRSALEEAGIRYAIGGSWASTAFGEPRFTNDVDILAGVTHGNVGVFLRHLPETFYADVEEARRAIGRGRPFNVIHIPTALKFDLFPSAAFPLGNEELDPGCFLGRHRPIERTHVVCHTGRHPASEIVLVQVGR